MAEETRGGLQLSGPALRAPARGHLAETGLTLAAELLSGDVDPRPGAPELLRRALASLPRGVRRVALRADAGYLAVAAHREGVRFAIGAKRIAPLWRILARVEDSEWVEAIDMPARSSPSPTTARPGGPPTPSY